MRVASASRVQPGVSRRRRSASARVSGGTPPRQGVHCLAVRLMATSWYPPSLFARRIQPVVASSAAVGLWSAPVPEARSRHQQPSPLETAVALAPRIRAAAAETERQRRLSPELVRALAAGGVFRMCVPRALGGGEVDPATMIETVETLAAADGAAGWSAMIGATSGVASAYLAEEAAQEIYGSDPEVVSGGAFAPLGKATVVDGGYRVSGRWPFASGCEHCAWLMGGSVVLDGGQPRLLPSGMPDNRLMLFPAAAVRIIDTWDVAGLRGTGSHDIAVEDQFVPAARSLSLISDRPRASGPLYAFRSEERRV